MQVKTWNRIYQRWRTLDYRCWECIRKSGCSSQRDGRRCVIMYPISNEKRCFSMTYQLLNENYVPARNLKNTNIRNVIFFLMFIFDISFNRHTNKYQYKLSHQLAVRGKFGHGLTQNRCSLYGLNTHSSSTPSTVHTFCVGVT